MTIAEQHDALSRGLIDVGLLRPQLAPSGSKFRQSWRILFWSQFLTSIP
jgi:hypothetical protein